MAKKLNRKPMLVIDGREIRFGNRRYQKDTMSLTSMNRLARYLNAVNREQVDVEIEYDLTTTVYVYR